VTSLIVPPFEKVPWPTLGPGVCQAIEERLVFGPGDLLGRRAVLDDEQRALIYRMYEVHPKGSPREGKRRFQRVHLSLRKGLRKTELAAWIAATELDDESPVRVDGWRRRGKLWEPVGRPVTDPFIPMLAYTEDQSEELGFGALYKILSHPNCTITDKFDIGLERIMRTGGDGKAVALANAPDQADGDRTTHEHKDETHRWVLPRHKETDQVTRANLLKRPLADPWELVTTTMYAPGEGSVAESAHDFAKKIATGEIPNPRMFFFHRQASPKWDLNDREQRIEAIREASGIAAEWSDIEGIAAQWDDPDADKDYLERAWTNRPVQGEGKAFDAERWKDKLHSDRIVPKGALVTAGWDGSRYWDATALVACEVATGYEWIVAIWTRPDLPPGTSWEVPEHEAEAAVDELFADYNVWRFYADPSKWQTNVSAWAGKYGKDRVLAWEPTRTLQQARAVRAYAAAMTAGEVTHGGVHDAIFTAHIGNAHKRYLAQRDEDGSPLWIIQKERPASPHKMDAAQGGCWAWWARLEAIADGAHRPAFRSNYEDSGLTFASSR
jgi:hypothetical protein